MKAKLSKTVIENIVKIGALICLVALLVQFYSVRTTQFRYYYSEGRPWSYEELQAPFDFPIYKTDEVIEAERLEAISNYSPCFRSYDVGIQSIIDSITNGSNYEEVKNQYNNQILTQSVNELSILLNQIYDIGIISGEDAAWLNDSNYSTIRIVDSHQMAKVFDVNLCLTPVGAYSFIKQQVDSTVFAALEQLFFHSYLVPNLHYDPVLSTNMRTELINSVSATEGVIQRGERIIDRGEIVTPQKYQILSSLSREYEKNYSSGYNLWSMLGDFLLITFFVLLLLLYLVHFRPAYYKGIKNVLFFLILVGTLVALSAGTIKLGQKLDLDMCVYIVPIAWVPILVRVFFDARTSLYIHWITLILIALLLDDPFTYVIIQVAVGMVVVTSLKDISERSQLARTALYVFLTYALTYTALTLSITGDVTKIEWIPFVLFAINCTLLLLAYGLIYVCEKAFKMISSMTLIELSNVNSDLLLRLAEEAPGTFQHCLQVANLASEAAKNIGADSLLVRTGAMYHDIGKMVCPQNFTENQIGGTNPLNDIPILDAAAIVLGHIENGVKIAKKENLPQPIIDFIQTHHGTSKARYFFNIYKNQHPDEVVDESLFTYAGPRPFTREQGILMMADGVEARSRSMQEYTEQSINDMVEQMVSSQMNDGQLRDTPLTFKDIENIKEVFKEKLKNIYHHRIAYPELKKN